MAGTGPTERSRRRRPDVVTGRLSSARSRLLLAAALTLTSLGMTWSAQESTTTAGYVTPSFCTTTYDGYLDCTYGGYAPGVFVPGVDGRGFEAPARVLLVPALAALAVASRRRTPTTERLVRAAAWALAGAAVLAVGTGSAAGAPIVTVAAALAAASVAWPGLVARAAPRPAA